MKRISRLREFTTEEEMATYVIAWLENQDYEVFQEVQMSPKSKRADLVGRRGSTIAIVETKLSFGEKVIEQANRWRHEATFTLVAVPVVHHHALLEYACRELGIGILTVSRFEGAWVHMSPQMNRRRGSRLANTLNYGHKTHGVAGAPHSDYWTPFRATCDRLREYLTKHDGATLKECMGEIQHHYQTPSTARGAIRKWVERGKVPGVRAELQGRAIHLFLTNATTAGTA